MIDIHDYDIQCIEHEILWKYDKSPCDYPDCDCLLSLRKDMINNRILVNQEEILLVQREDRSTVIYTENGGRYVLSETLSETEARLDKELFFRCHKSYIINLSRIRNITPYGRWTYVVQLDGTDHDALITHEKYEELEKKFG